MRTKAACKFALLYAVIMSPCAQSQCPTKPVDTSSQTQWLSCGGSAYQISFSYNGQNTVLANSYSPIGTCAGDTRQCNCSYENYYTLQGSVSPMALVPENNTVWYVSWSSTNYYPIRRVACKTGPCCPNANDSQQNPPTYVISGIAEDYVTCS